ncbi:MAG TPA: phosphonopyruvate decarboxylase [Methylomirabilota bacterium]|nr:phosphonopyruvate decarboxylase [Methylomirabilota bacterium]
MISGHDLAALLERHRFDFFTGVPCSLVEDVIAVLEHGRRAPYVAAVREDVAVGMAAGAWFAGRRPCVLMQNSGLGTSLNALASLSLMYGLPALVVVTWRGHGGKDAPEHILTGAITPNLLELLGMPYRVLSTETAAADVEWAAREMDARMQPVAIVVPPKVVETGGTHAHADAARSATPSTRAIDAGASLSPSISRLAALTAARKPLGSEPIVHANGYICRESFAVGDRPQNFYMIGSMGLASAIGLGLALARPTKPVVIFDGDGNLLMNFGILAMVGGLAPRNLVHVVFDNEAYGSTGNQASPSRGVRLDRVAAAAGYRSSVAVTAAGDVEGAVQRALTGDGPHFVLAKVTTEEADVPRIPFSPAEIRDRFRASLPGA